MSSRPARNAAPASGPAVTPRGAPIITTKLSKFGGMVINRKNQDMEATEATQIAQAAEDEPPFQNGQPNLVFFVDGSHSNRTGSGGYAVVYKNPGYDGMYRDWVFCRFKVDKSVDTVHMELMGMLEAMGIAENMYDLLQSRGVDCRGCELRIFSDSSSSLDRLARADQA